MIPSLPSGLCDCWGFLVLAPVSCGIAHGWLRRQGPQRLMMDSKTRWQLWNNDPGRDRGNCGLGAIQNTIVWFPIFDGDTVERKMQLHIPSDIAVAWSPMIFRHHKASCKVVSWTMWSRGSHGSTLCHGKWIKKGNVLSCAAVYQMSTFNRAGLWEQASPPTANHFQLSFINQKLYLYIVASVGTLETLETYTGACMCCCLLMDKYVRAMRGEVLKWFRGRENF